MNPSYRRGIGDLLSWARIALNNALQSSDVLAAMSAYGFDEPRLQEGIALLETAMSLHALQKEEYGKQYAATQALRKKWQEVDDQHYAVHRNLAHLALRDDPQRRQALELSERKKQRFNAWLDQASLFYTNALKDPEIVDALREFNVTREDLEQSQALVQEVEVLKGAQEIEKTRAQQATKDRDGAFEALNEWLVKFRAVARIALAHSPQHLESLQLGSIP